MRKSPKNARFPSGLPDSPIVNAWRKMMERCYHKDDARYKYYGARGISVCDRWHDAKNFVSDMGDRPDGMTLDRINNDGNYSKENCRWVTMAQQNANRRNVITIEFNDEIMCMEQWADRLGVDPKSMRYWLNRGKSGAEVIDYFMKKREAGE